MSREQDRIRQKMEADPIRECNKVRQRCCPNLYHYLMTQIADMVKQLYEWFYLKKNEIKKKQKIYLLTC